MSDYFSVNDGTVKWPHEIFTLNGGATITPGTLPLQIEESGTKIICYSEAESTLATNYLTAHSIDFTAMVFTAPQASVDAIEGLTFNSCEEVTLRIADQTYYPPGEEVKALKARVAALELRVTALEGS